MATPSRQVRVTSELWNAAEEACARRGTTRAAYINAKLAELVESDAVARAFVEGLTSPGGRDDDYTPAALDAVTLEQETSR